MTAPVDWTNPCARAAALEAAYYRLISGAAEASIRTKTLEAEEEVRFQSADRAELKQELEIARAECAALTTNARPRRFCFTAG